MKNTTLNPKERKNRFIVSSFFFFSGLNSLALGFFPPIEVALILLGVCYLGVAILEYNTRLNEYSQFMVIVTGVILLLMNLFVCAMVAVSFPVLFWIWPFVLFFETVIVILIAKNRNFT